MFGLTKNKKGCIMKRNHTLKLDDRLWNAVFNGFKSFEVRKNDRYFQAGDLVRLRRYDTQEGCYIRSCGEKTNLDYLAEKMHFRIGFVLSIPENYVVFSLLKHGYVADEWDEDEE